MSAPESSAPKLATSGDGSAALALNSLVIFQDPQDGDWYMGVAGTNYRLRFAGETDEIQQTNIQAMAGWMEEGQTTNWDLLFDDAGEGFDAANLLSGTGEIWYADGVEPVWTADEGENALIDIVQAGLDLLGVLPP